MTRFTRAILLVAVALAPVGGAFAVAQPVELPQAIEIPPARPGEDVTPDIVPLPAPRPRDEPAAAEEAPASPDEAAEAPMPAEEAACRARLRGLGVAFTEHPPIDEPEGCGAPHPLSVSQLPGEVALQPAAVLTCAMAEATATFVRDHAAPLAEREFGSRLAAAGQVSSYVCRPRAGGRKLSEHAFANALDWGSLQLADGTVVDVRAHRRSEPRRARLISRLREAACGPFRTVLGPGSDADHADHFHFDLAPRHGGGVWCR